MKPDKTRNTRAARHRAATAANGGERIDVHLGPEAANALELLRTHGLRTREAVERGLIAIAQTISQINTTKKA
jgi:uncharacterized membrane protein